MHAWTNLPFVRFSIFAIVGIVCQRWVPYLWESPVSVLSVLFLVFVCVRLFRYFVRIRGLYFVVGIVGLSLVSYTFGWVAKNHNELTDEDHWRHVKGKIIAIQGKVSSSVLEKENYFRYDLEVEQVLTENNRLSPVCGKIHFYIKREKTGYKILDLKEETPLAYGDVVQVYTTPRAIPPPSNPQEFDYSGYMALQNIHGQCFVSKGAYTVLANQPDNKILAASYQVREHLRVKIKDLILEDEARAIALALLIGVKDYLSDDIKRAYASAGAIHVLAVSGLHVGILYLLLLLVLKPWEKYKAGLWLISMTTVVAIWFYTFITGMSPSVLRAATMFTVFAISRALGRKNNGYNALGIAAFILLLYDPYLIYSVGFQLSFLAVGGIMYLQPCIYRWWIAPNAFLDKAWSITAVSLAAQMATFPLSVYYFNQFPTYFFISNFFVIPGASIIMIGGVLMILAEKAWSLAGGIVGMILTGVIQLMNFLVKSVEQIPGSLVTWLYIEGNEVLLTYGILILIFLGIHQRSSFYLNIGLSCLLILFGLGYCKQL